MPEHPVIARRRSRRGNPYRFMRCFAALAMTMIVTSCLTPTGTQRPAEVVNYGTKGGAGSTGMHTVLAGDTVYTVSKQYNLPLRDIIAVNDLSAPYKLPPGYRLKLPPPREYTAQAGDTLNRVSRMFHVSVSETAKLNNLQSPFLVNKGQVLRLPAAQPKLAQEFANPPPVATAPAFQVAGVEAETLPPPPGTQSGTFSKPQAGTQVQEDDRTAASGFPPAPAVKSSVGTMGTLQPPAQAPAAAPPAAQTASVQKAAATLSPKVPARASSRFMRPVDGKVISNYGPKDDGLHNDGINIKAAKGTAVRAAENGVVAYTGKKMAGYGNLVLIRHADKWMTAYAHMDKVLVSKGDVVKAGQSIGTVGATGQVDSPQLHFEVRKGTQAVDPAKYL